MKKRFVAANFGEKIIFGLIFLACATVAAMVIFVIGYILLKGLPHISWEFLTTQYKPGLGETGIFAMIISTLLLVLMTVVIAVPIGVGAAIYLHEYSPKGKWVNWIRFATECLSGIPSILFGLFGFALFVTVLDLNYTILSGALTLSVMVLPIIMTNTEEALNNVPNSLREASYALGAGKLTTIMKMVLPSSIGGILTGAVLSVGRIVGETAAVIYTVGTAAGMVKGFLSSGRTLAVHVYMLTKEGTDTTEAFAAAAVLLIMVGLINAFSRWTGKRFSPTEQAKREEKRAIREQKRFEQAAMGEREEG